MATFDQLSDQQRAIIELILRRGQSYDELSGKLGLPEARVRELARDALVELAPVTAKGVESDWRPQLADYVLGQQAGPESTATRGHLRRSEAARSWTRSLLDSLDSFYANGMPAIPEGERGARRGREETKPAKAAAAPAAATQREPSKPLSPEARRAVRRRRLTAAAALAAVILVVVLVWPVGLLTKDDNGGGSQQASSSGSAQQASGAKTPAGVAVIAQQNTKRQVVVQAANLPRTQQGQAYEVWLYNNPQDAKSMGAQVTDSQGRFQGAAPLPKGYARYQFVDVSREPIDNNTSHSGQSVLRGKLPKLKKAPANLKKGQPASLGQVVLLPPQG